MKPRSLMQQCLGEDWAKLPVALQKHYANDLQKKSREQGHLTISYQNGRIEIPSLILV